MDSNPDNVRHEWLVRMKVEGSISVGTKIEFDNVEFIQRKKWIEALSRVYELSRDAAEKVAVRKVSDLLNILSFVSDSSIILVGVERVDRSDSAFPVTIRILDADEVQTCRNLEGSDNPELFRALGYYRKGLNEPDPFDAFLAFWSSVEIVVSQPRARAPVANRIRSFAKTHSIEINTSEVDDLRGTRNRIVHGAKQYDIDQIGNVAEKIPRIRDLARRFLYAEIPHTGITLDNQ